MRWILEFQRLDKVVLAIRRGSNALRNRIPSWWSRRKLERKAVDDDPRPLCDREEIQRQKAGVGHDNQEGQELSVVIRPEKD